MPSKTPHQARTMAAVCKDPTGKTAKATKIPRDVACDYHQADKAKPARRYGKRGR